MFQFLVVCVFAVANAEYINPSYQANSIVTSHGSGDYVTQPAYYSGANNNYASPAYKIQKYPEHVPVIKDGVPVDTPEVQQARAEHFALYAQAAAAAEAAKAANAQKGQYNDDGSYNQQTQAYYPAPARQHSPAHSSYIYQSGGHSSNSAAYSGYQVAPVDTVDVQQAKAAHYTALQRAAARAASPESHHRYRRGIFDYHSLQSALPQHVPVITKDGVPQETPEVQVAKAQHLLAHANAKAGHDEWRQGSGNYGGSSGIWTNYGTPEASNVQYSVNHNSGSWQKYTGPLHYPIIDKDGVPVETPEVQSAKQQHLLAHSQAKYGLYSQAQSGSYYGSSYPHASISANGGPEETPEVKLAKAQHFAAHAEAQARQIKWAGQAGFEYSHGDSHY